MKFLAICESLAAALSKDTVKWPRPKGVPARANKAPDHLTDRTEGKAMHWEGVLTYVLLGALIACIGGVVYIVVTPQKGEHFTELYILNSSGVAADYPTDLIEGESGEVIVGVVNREWGEVRYRMEMRLENRTLDTYRFSLGHRENWINRVSFTPEITGKNLKLQFLLFRADNESVYREIHLWIDVVEVS